MFSSLIHEVRIWPVVWKRRLVMYWRIGDKGALIFVGTLLSVFAVLGSIIFFAYTRPTPANVAYVESSQREARHKRALELRCLAENVFFEARGESIRGQLAVAEVTMNRTRSPYFPHSVCEVVHETRWDAIRGRQVAHFSWTEIEDFRAQPREGPAWEQAEKVAQAAYDATYSPIVPGALFYHATRIHPDWAKTQRFIETIGNHSFYR
jgi:spore germination cell wall hydrolase CwlJ-like protein